MARPTLALAHRPLVLGLLAPTLLALGLLAFALLAAVSSLSAQPPPDAGAAEGSWGPVLKLPTHPEQMAVLPSGKVLMWPWAPDRRTPPHGPLALWDPADGRSTTYPGSGIESASGLEPRDGHGRVICIDEGHENRFTLEGRFAMAAEIWEGDGFTPRSSTFAFSSDSLHACDLLVIANALHPRNVDDWSLPTPSAFTPEEVQAVRAWVEDGGGLLLLADHMPMPGAATDLAAAFGARFNNGFALDPKDMSGALVFRRSEGSLGSHAITNGQSSEERVDSVMTFTGQAFLAEPHFVPLLIVPDGLVSFMPRVAWEFPKGTPRIPVGGWLQGAAATLGSGRVVIFGEAAQFRPGEDGFSPRGQNGRVIRNVMLWLAGRLGA